MKPLLLDTHIALWLAHGDPRLRCETQNRIDACWQAGGWVYVSAVTAWELARLVERNRIALDIPVRPWLDRLFQRRGIQELPLTSDAAARAYDFFQFPARDPADRLLMAAAVGEACPLVSYDERILAFAERFGSQYGLDVVS